MLGNEYVIFFTFFSQYEKYMNTVVVKTMYWFVVHAMYQR